MGFATVDGARAVTTQAGRRSRAPMLRAKLRAPTLPAHFLPRARLDALLDEIVDRPLTLIDSPAGSGKTTLLAGWVASTTVPTSWLTLDEVDADVAEFWFEAIAAQLAHPSPASLSVFGVSAATNPAIWPWRSSGIGFPISL